MIDLKGIFPALVTPFTKEGRVNDTSLQKIIRMNLEKGVNGFYVGGSSGETFLLSLDERKHILEVVAQEVKENCAIIAHIGCISTDQAIELGKHAEKVGVDAISSIPPFYYNFSFNEIKDYYADIQANVDLPMIIYNFPAFSGVHFSIDNLKELLEGKKVIGIKHTSYDFYQLDRIRQINERIVIFNGHDEVFLAGLAMGAQGTIGLTYNFMAEKFIEIKKLYENNKHQEAGRLQTQANEIIEVLIKVGALPGTKAILSMMGIDCGECRRPFKKLNKQDYDLLQTAISGATVL